jgi:hypothetical protein
MLNKSIRQKVTCCVIFFVNMNNIESIANKINNYLVFVCIILNFMLNCYDVRYFKRKEAYKWY